MSASETRQLKKRTSVSRQFNRTLLLIYVLSIAVVAPTFYFNTERQVRAQADAELNLLVDMVGAIQNYVAGHLRPFMLERGLMYSPGFSGIVATSLVAEKFVEQQPAYYIKNISDNPLNPANKPQPFEAELLERFRADGDLGELTATGVINGKPMLVSAAPKVSKKGCLRCHGAPNDAPQEIRTEFGGTDGYNYGNGEVVGVSLVGVPLDDIQTTAIQQSLRAIALLTGLFALIFVTINWMVRRALISPIVSISNAAKEISLGKLDRPMESERNDEIGDLSNAIELLRRSFVKVMKRLSPQQ